jgi:hypothetical protein
MPPMGRKTMVNNRMAFLLFFEKIRKKNNNRTEMMVRGAKGTQSLNMPPTISLSEPTSSIKTLSTIGCPL